MMGATQDWAFQGFPFKDTITLGIYTNKYSRAPREIMCHHMRIRDFVDASQLMDLFCWLNCTWSNRADYIGFLDLSSSRSKLRD